MGFWGIFLIIFSSFFLVKNPAFLLVSLGQAHFFQTYYRNFKAKRVTQKRIQIYLLFALTLLSSYYFFLSSNLLAVITAIYFFIHFYFDEKYLNSEKNLRNDLFFSLPFFAVYVFQVLVNQRYVEHSNHIFNLSFFCYIFLLSFFQVKKIKISVTTLNYFTWTTFAFLANIFNIKYVSVFLPTLFVIFHYFHWYYKYWEKQNGVTGKKFEYLCETLIFIFVFISLAAYHYKAKSSSIILSGLFDIDAFFIWTLLHLVFTTRDGEWLSLFTKDQKMHILHFEYRGGRDYIDISQISEKLLNALGHPFENISNLHVRVYKPIDSDCFFINGNENYKKEDPVAKIRMGLGNNTLTFLLFPIPAGQKIFQKSDDPQFDINNMMLFEKNEIRLNEGSNYEQFFYGYLMMRMGREVGIRFFGSLKPRAIEYFIQRIPKPIENKNITFKTLAHVKRGFVKAEIYLKEEYLGFAMIKV